MYSVYSYMDKTNTVNSPLRHSRKRTALLTDAFSNPHFTSQSNSVFTHCCKRTLSRKADADTFENENWIFLLFTLSRKRTPHV